MTQRVLAPWTSEQVQSMRAYQASQYTSSLVCLRLDHEPGVPLVVNTEGLDCPLCNARREWVHQGIANGTWRVIELDQAERIDDLVTRWHDGEGKGWGLDEWLGLTSEEYGMWLETSQLPASYEVPRRPRSTSSSQPAIPASPRPSS